MKLELGRRGWGAVTDRRLDARRLRLRVRETGLQGEAIGRVPVAGTLTWIPLQGAGGLLPQLRKQKVARGLQVLEGAELDDGAGHGCRDPALRGSWSLATPGPLFSAADSAEPPKLLPPGGRGRQTGCCQHAPRGGLSAARAQATRKLRVRRPPGHRGKSRSPRHVTRGLVAGSLT